MNNILILLQLIAGWEYARFFANRRTLARRIYEGLNS